MLHFKLELRKTLIHLADIALYRAKSEGRNRYVLYAEGNGRQAGQRSEVLDAARSTAPEADLFDRAAFLGRMEGDEALAKRIAQLFLDGLPDLLTDLEAAAQAADTEALTRHAHTLKGNTATLGGFRAQQASLRLETAARRGDIQAARGMVEEVKGEVEALAQAVRASVGVEAADADETGGRDA